jgi:hypothetical protein
VVVAGTVVAGDVVGTVVVARLVVVVRHGQPGRVHDAVVASITPAHATASSRSLPIVPSQGPSVVVTRPDAVTTEPED